MLIAVSKVTRQGQISVPAEVRRDLGIRPGTQLIWDRGENGEYRVRPKRTTWTDLHALIGPLEVRLTDEELKAARREFLASRAERAEGGR